MASKTESTEPWISTKEADKLPPIGERVLVYDPNRHTAPHMRKLIARRLDPTKYGSTPVFLKEGTAQAVKPSYWAPLYSDPIEYQNTGSADDPGVQGDDDPFAEIR